MLLPIKTNTGRIIFILMTLIAVMGGIFAGIRGKDLKSSSTQSEQAVCGNEVRETGEFCDDGNRRNDDDCSSICTIAPTDDKVSVFLTSQTQSGNLGNVEAANTICQESADSVLLAGVWKAFISGFSQDIGTKLPAKKYVTIDGKLLANSKAELISQALQNPVLLTELFENAAANTFWSGTKADGTYSNEYCQTPTDPSTTSFGKIGNTKNTSATWFSVETKSCSESHRLLCYRDSVGVYSAAAEEDASEDFVDDFSASDTNGKSFNTGNALKGKGLSAITIKVKQSVTNGKITAKALKKLPPGVDLPPSKKVLKSLRFTLGNNLTKEHIDSAVIEFELSPRELGSLAESDIMLGRNVNNKWKALTTGVVAHNNGKTQFRATSPGFSDFAVTTTFVSEPVCGDAVVNQSTEQCDDGNIVSHDGCSSSCKEEFCGDGVKQQREECEDGNTIEGDGCSSICKVERCGNGVQEGTEKCDDGNTSEIDTCSNSCQTVPMAIWKRDVLSMNVQFKGVWGTSVSNVYAIADDGLYHLDGTSWKKRADLNGNLMAIWGVDASNIYVSGYDSTTEVGSIYHYDGSRWQEVFSKNQERYRVIWGSGAQDIYALGANSIQHFDGNQWTLFTGIPDTSVYSVWGTGPSHMYFGGMGTVRYFNGQTSTLVINESGMEFSGIWGTGADNIYAIEKSDTVFGAGKVFHFDGNSWTLLPVQISQPMTIWGLDASHIIIGGISNFMLYDGSTWQPMANSLSARLTFNPGNFTGIWGTSITNLYATSKDHVIAHFSRLPDTSAPICGNSITEFGEQCDDGTDNGKPDKCTAQFCQRPVCGDGKKNRSVEECDITDPQLESYQSCGGATSGDQACKIFIVPRCGNNHVDVGEECDDSNTNDYDACSNSCTTPLCGDAKTQGAEACDDGNINHFDGCSNTCSLPRCGDGGRQTGEECDDRNGRNGDGCSSSCRFEEAQLSKLLHYWPFEENAIEDSGVDIAGNNPGTFNVYWEDFKLCSENNCPVISTDHFGKSLMFHGASHAMYVYRQLNLADKNIFSIETTVLLPSILPDRERIIMQIQGPYRSLTDSTPYLRAIVLDQNGIGFAYNGSQSKIRYDLNSPETKLLLGKWVHITVVRTPNSIGGFDAILYINGTLRGFTSDEGTDVGNQTFSIIAGQASSGQNGSFFKGSIAEVKVYDRGLSESEVQESAKKILQKIYPPQCGDGFVDAPEVCDEGVNNGKPNTCTTQCNNPMCQDGIVNLAIEECDDGNGIDLDSCSNACREVYVPIFTISGPDKAQKDAPAHFQYSVRWLRKTP